MKISFTTAKEVLGLTDDDIEMIKSAVNSRLSMWEEDKVWAATDWHKEQVKYWSALLAKLEKID